ncbi:MAG TPA: hypothetical protein DCO71_05335 [Gammaproteobacteria bacterium]|nr:hypothetical protein [Gammaproteobacteria bacterium]
MAVFKRLSATLVSRIDQVVSQIENHDAVVEVAIRDARQAVAKSKVRMARLQSDGVRLRRKLAELRKGEAQWTQRARSCATKDEDRAIECLRRRRECQRQITELEKVLEQHAVLEERLTRNIRTAEERVGEMSQQRNMMRTRQSAAEALNSIAGMDETVVSDVADAFERWEVKVVGAELEAGSPDVGDSLEREYLGAEEREALRAELENLMANKENNDDN